MHLRVHSFDDALANMINTIQNRSHYILASIDDKVYRIENKDIYYFEAVDRKVFLCSEKQTYEVKDKLYRLEEKYKGSSFVRVSKSIILNIDKIESIYPELSGRFEVRLCNGEKVKVSRAYVPFLKKALGMEG